MHHCGPEPDEDYLLSFGQANLVQEGTDISIITWGAMVQKSIDAVNSFSLDDGVVEIIDLRTLNPLDFSTINKSIQKTGKALVVHEDVCTFLYQICLPKRQ